jgi:hypothetical protein
MDQKELGDSLGKHLDAVADITYWALLLAVIFLWAGVANQDPIKALGMDIARKQALFVACGFYLVANLFIFIHFLRIGDILHRVDDATLPVALTKLCTHKWVANPFAFFGDTVSAKIHGGCGFGLLIVVWWIGNASLYSLADNVFSLLGVLLQGVFLGVGLASMWAIQRVLPIVLKRLETIDAKLQAEVKSTIPYRAALTFAGIGVGVMIAFVVNFSKFMA